MNLIERELLRTKKKPVKKSNKPKMFMPASVGTVNELDVDATYTFYQMTQKAIFRNHRPKLLRDHKERVYGAVFYTDDEDDILNCDEMQGYLHDVHKVVKKLKAGMTVVLLPTYDLQLTQFSDFPGRQFILEEDPFTPND